MPVAIGTRLGPYEILAPIGAGGMGEVYRARDTKLKRDVALKVLPEAFARDPGRMARFQREAEVLASLNHPNIAHIYGVEERALVMELVEGESPKGPMPFEEAWKIALQIADALEYAHDRGVIHRDLKPANVKVTPDGVVKLLDFGLAKEFNQTPEFAAADPENSPTLTLGATVAGTVLGTAAYMAPEQAKGKRVDKRADIWSWGVVLYELLTGERLFKGDEVAETLAQVLTKEPDWDRAPVQVQRLLQRCLEKDPKKRLRDIGEARYLLDNSPSPTPVPSRGRRWWVSGLFAAIAIGAVGGGWVMSRSREPSQTDRVLQLQIDPPMGGRFVLGELTVGGLAISPDGKAVAYVAAIGGKTGLWIRPLDGVAATLVPGSETAESPFWSPDGKSIGFVTGAGRFRQVDLSGGMPVDLISGTFLAPRGGSWGSDGSILIAQETRGILRVPPGGGAPSQLIAPVMSRGELQYYWPQLLPEGRFLYFARTNRPESTGVYAASLAQPGDRVRLLTSESNAVYATDSAGKGYLLWLRGRSLVAQEFNPATLQFLGEPQRIVDGLDPSPQGAVLVAASSNGLLVYGSFGSVMQFSWMDRAGQVVRNLGEPLEGSVYMFRPSPDGKQIAIQRGPDLWVLDTQKGFLNRFTTSGASSTHPVWSPDSRTVLFTHLDRPELFRKTSNGVGEEEVVGKHPNTPYVLEDWSADGHWAVSRDITPETSSDIWVLPVTPDGNMQKGAEPKPYLQTRFFEGGSRFFPEPDPRWLAYVSNESGRYEVYIDGFPERRGRQQISNGGGRFPQWGPNGRELFYVSLDNRLMAVRLNPKAGAIQVVSSPSELFPLPILNRPGDSPYEVSRDGQRVLVLTSPEVAQQPLNVIVNWPALLKTRAVMH